MKLIGQTKQVESVGMITNVEQDPIQIDGLYIAVALSEGSRIGCLILSDEVPWQVDWTGRLVKDKPIDAVWADGMTRNVRVKAKTRSVLMRPIFMNNVELAVIRIPENAIVRPACQ